MGLKKFIKAVAKPIRIVTSLFKMNPKLAIFAIAATWLFGSLLSRKENPDFGDTEFDNFEKGILINKQSNDATIPVVYGERLIGGTRCFIETSGTDNTHLYIALILCEGEINGITEIRVDDKVVTFTGAMADNVQRTVASSDGNFFKDSVSHLTIEPHFGTDGQSSSSLLSELSSWGSNHKLSGVAYLALKFKWNQDIYSGIPRVQAKVQGKKVVTLASNLSEQTASFSTNPAFCLLDYLRNERYGKGIATTDIDLQSFYDASQVCVTQVTPFSGGSDINIFDTNVVLDTSKKVIENVRDLLGACRGFLPFVGGKYNLIVETTGTASITLDEDDIIGGYSLASPDKNNKYNRVIVSYVNPDRNFQVDQAQFPPINDSSLPSADQHATMKTADGGFLLEGRFDFPTITNTYQAEEMAEIILRRSRESLALDITVSFNAYELAIGDIVNITHSSLGFSSKAFRVMNMTFNEDFTVKLMLVEHQNSHYTYASKTQVSSTPSTNLPSPFTIQPPASVTLSDEMIEYADGVVLTRLNIVIGASPDSFVQYYQVEAKKTSESNFKIISSGTELRHEFLNVIDGENYSVRVKSINAFGVSSTFTSATHTVIGATDTPTDINDLSVSMVGSNQLELTWTPVADLDISWYEIRFQDVTSNATWNESTPIAKVVRRKSNAVTLNAKVGSYCIKAVDKLGNSSANASIVSTNVSSLANFTNVFTLNE
tara:strand:- start:15 stop:2162 length:2148 start_codon:yes stop_codon:yes gene_type:complete